MNWTGSDWTVVFPVGVVAGTFCPASRLILVANLPPNVSFAPPLDRVVLAEHLAAEVKTRERRRKATLSREGGDGGGVDVFGAAALGQSVGCHLCRTYVCYFRSTDEHTEHTLSRAMWRSTSRGLIVSAFSFEHLGVAESVGGGGRKQADAAEGRRWRSGGRVSPV